jgi:hypothetical protein
MARRLLSLSGLILALCMVWIAPALALQKTDVPPQRWAILMAGISGAPDLQQEYFKNLEELHALLTSTFGYPRDNVYVLFDDPDLDATLVGYKSTQENFAQVCKEIGRRAGREDVVFLFIAGHGNLAREDYKLNLVGPDPTAADLAVTLYSIPARLFIVVNTTNCSGASIRAMAHERAIIATATKSGREKNKTHMAGFFIDALKDNTADRDKDGRISVLEAFEFATSRVEEYYAREGHLQTEHAILDDNGDGQGHASPGPENGDGILARTTYLDASAAESAGTSLGPEAQSLRQELRSVQQQIERLKYAKPGMAEAEYEQKLETLLLRLAEINAKLRKKK